MLKRLFMNFIPGVVTALVVGLLWTAPVESLRFVEVYYTTWSFILVWVPPVIFAGALSLAVYFHSNRLFWLALFLVFLYAYLFYDPLGLSRVFPGDGFTRPYNQSLMIFAYLIPLQCLVTHFTDRLDPLTPEGLMMTVALFGEFLGILVLFLIGGPVPARALYWLNGWTIPVSGIGTLPALPLGVLALLGFFLWYFHERSYYDNGKGILLWIAVAQTLPFVNGFDWYLASGTPLHFYMGSLLSSVLLAGWTLNYAWSKAYRDQLTQIRGRMALDERLERLAGHYTLVMIDIDEFKSFNDTYGHDAGDKVLRNVAEILERRSRGQVYRFGGEEFTIVYRGLGIEEVEDELETIRQAVADNKVEVTRKSQRATKKLQKRVTISLGAAEPTENLDTPQKVLNAADEAMFKAKDGGRNQLKLAT